MKYYWIIEFNPKNWHDTEFIISQLNGVHYHTSTSDAGNYRKFAAFLNSEEVTFARLSLDASIDIVEMTKSEMIHLKSLGYLK